MKATNLLLGEVFEMIEYLATWLKVTIPDFVKTGP